MAQKLPHDEVIAAFLVDQLSEAAQGGSGVIRRSTMPTNSACKLLSIARIPPDNRSRELLEHIACVTMSKQYLEWYSFIDDLDELADSEFQSIVAFCLYAGFTSGDVARATDFDPSTVVRWAEGATVPPRAVVRERIKADILRLIAARIDKWAVSSEFRDFKSDWRTLKNKKGEELSTEIVDMSITQERVRDLYVSLLKQSH